ncbi:LmbU family transcriptional regulator [Streptomyces sp. NPDC058954]|uniref:LmbU family transcriptional regulator n=1 Tax=Streptomyces sp. NPDC058954 TaxID=3346677 RepID=UPI0036C2926C
MSSNYGAEGHTTALPQPTPWMTRTPPTHRGMRKPRNDQVLTTRVGLQIPDVLSFDEWERAGRQLAGVVDSSSWWLGDWLTYGKDHYSDRYLQGIRSAGLRYQTLRNYAWVARRFDMTRRRARLTFQHHAEVASLPTEEQDRWLLRAEELSWTTKQLRNALREARGVEPTAASDTVPFRQLAVARERYQRWSKAAEQSGVEVAEWVLTTLDSAAEQTIEDTDEPASAAIAEAASAGVEEAVPVGVEEAGSAGAGEAASVAVEGTASAAVGEVSSAAVDEAVATAVGEGAPTLDEGEVPSAVEEDASAVFEEAVSAVVPPVEEDSPAGAY